MSGKLLTEQHLEFISLKGGCTGLFEATLVKIQHCWKSHTTAQFSSIGYWATQEVSVLNTVYGICTEASYMYYPFKPKSITLQSIEPVCSVFMDV